MSNQSGVQQAVRNATSTALSYQGDWHALFDADGIAAGTWNERMLAWINAKLGSTYANISDAQQAYAVDQGFYNWSSMATVLDLVQFSDGATVQWADGSSMYWGIA